MKDLISFFTRIPVEGKIERVVEQLWMLPLLALITSLPPLVVLYSDLPAGNIVAVFLLYATLGLIHLDGLADFSDGLMAKGSREAKIKAMKDVNTGIAGTFSVLLVLIVQIESLKTAPFYSILVAELNSKFSMLLAISAGKSAGDGLGSYFIRSFKGRQILAGTAMFFLILATLASFDLKVIFSVVALTTVYPLILISMRNFGELNGDCIGAIAEVSRATSLLILGTIHNL